MEAGPNMLYPAQCVDGRVAAEGGREILEGMALRGSCPTGESFALLATSRLKEYFNWQYVICTATPFFACDNHRAYLANCYASSIQCALQHGITSVAFPLLGAGKLRQLHIDEV